MPRIETLWLREPSRGVPNNPRLPVVLARSLLPAPRRERARIEAEAGRSGWGGAWEGGIYPFHHFHADTHEALAVVSGSARLQLGGPEGPEVTLDAGDLVVLPAGVGHRCIGSDDGFVVVGLYPDSAEPDLELASSLSESEAAARVARVAEPEGDPLPGVDLLRSWSGAAQQAAE